MALDGVGCCVSLAPACCCTRISATAGTASREGHRTQRAQVHVSSFARRIGGRHTAVTCLYMDSRGRSPQRARTGCDVRLDAFSRDRTTAVACQTSPCTLDLASVLAAGCEVGAEGLTRDGCRIGRSCHAAEYLVDQCSLHAGRRAQCRRRQRGRWRQIGARPRRRRRSGAVANAARAPHGQNVKMPTPPAVESRASLGVEFSLEITYVTMRNGNHPHN